VSGDRVEIALLPGDAFRFDDRVLLVAGDPRALRLRWVGPAEPALALALQAAGVNVEPAAPAALCYRVPPDREAVLVIAPPGGTRAVDSGSLFVSGSLAAESCPPPGLRLGRASVIPDAGTTLLADRDGPLATMESGVITLALDPADPQANWTRDPSFPVFVAELARLLGAGQPHYEVAEGVIDPEESATRPMFRVPDLEDLVPTPARDRDPGVGLASALFVVAGLLLLLHFTLEAGWRFRPAS
jgi:hypothetical protein